jgi:hypothetical protein
MLLSLVIPLFNDEAVLPLLQRPDEVLAGLDCAAEIVRALSFSRNFGHQAAITAVLDVAARDAVVIADNT